MENEGNDKERIMMSLVCTFPDRVFTEMDQNDILEICSSEASLPPGEKDQIGNDMEVLFEERNPKMPPLGSRVKRGRDWRYEYQDNLGRGTVIGHSKREEWLIVEWDTGLRWSYRFGTTGTPSDKYDVELCCEPRVLVKEKIATGCLVTRGKTGIGKIMMKIQDILVQLLYFKALDQYFNPFSSDAVDHLRDQMRKAVYNHIGEARSDVKEDFEKPSSISTKPHVRKRQTLTC